MEFEIIVNMFVQMIEYNIDLNMVLIKNFGLNYVQQQVMFGGEIDIAVMCYLGIDLISIFGMEVEKDLKKVLFIVQKEFEKCFYYKWFDFYGFENMYVFIVLKEFVEKDYLDKVFDIKKYVD